MNERSKVPSGTTEFSRLYETGNFEPFCPSDKSLGYFQIVPPGPGTTRVIKDTSHHLVMEKPGKYNRIVLDFLQKT